ncbi:signal recognition particle, alpha subunit, N-terminal-domain-containing protein [Talaromyces proteolyticus]|uniref:Signal recognition particle receptor subunit alpha homolog n=1 Tax=Talaromyces proteolyticus TaxID=1131652 RepID=A0AAD4KKZ9_9EURO|nr:signal recognition particle, alpha subunit, N-terminal-domain-containing protein [Talaromyces proteolyticus]KAH8695178.1 signal recognition particle, alpha subunit, N-terminal-domain-containing protein [Talaromyces proteolyticus]
MLDAFEVITTSGVVLWSRSYAPVSSHVVNSLISEVFIEEKVAPAEGTSTAFRKEKYTLKWRRAKDLGLIFVAVYQSLLHLSWIDKLLDNIVTIFVDVYKDQLKSSRARVAEYPFDRYFDQQIQELENAAGPAIDEHAGPHEDEKKNPLVASDNGGPPPPYAASLSKAQQSAAQLVATSDESSPAHTPQSSRPTTPLANHLLTAKNGPAGRVSRRARKAANASSNASSGDESLRKGKSSKEKRARIWDVDGLADEDDGVNLDYSAAATEDHIAAPAVEAVAQETWGRKTAKGQFVLKDLGDEVHSILENADAAKTKSNTPSGVVGSSFNAIGGLFRNIVGGKTLTEADLEKPLKAMQDHLMQKNVAPEAALRLCDGVKQELVGKKTGNFQSVDAALRTATESSLRKILTPTSSLDLLHEIQAVTSPTVKGQTPRPYVISIVGVNGVGKSTNLSKICFFLLQNNYRVLIAACDTFRSGAVEQLRVHARNLRELSARENVGEVDLYEKGYGKDAANVAKDAVAYGAANKFDVVLIDTAGRRHNDQRLMSSLEKFAKFANPDKIFMVGEALVGTDSVMQARNFNQAFGTGRNLDGFIISKCDTVGDMVGTLVSMVHATGIPIVFLGVGQHYGDLRGLSVPWAVGLLMK